MNPLHLSASNLRAFDNLDLDLPAGCVVIGGDNGAGKSTILNAIDVALFCGRGELPGLLTLGEDELALELTFEHAGEMYRVRRGYSAKGRGKTTCDLERFDEQEWRPLTRETAEATQTAIEELLGLSRATFRASSFLAQGDGAAFTEASPRDRKAILAEILGLEVWDWLLEQARVELRVAEDGTVAARSRLAQLDCELLAEPGLTVTLATARVDLTDRSERKNVADGLLEQAQRAHAANAAAVERARAAWQQLATATEARERARQEYAAAVNAAAAREERQTELDQAAAEADTVAALETQLAVAREVAAHAARKQQLLQDAARREQARQRLADDAAALHAQAEELVGKADHLEQHIDDAGDCDRCGQTLGAEAAARAAASFRAEALHLEAKAAATTEGNDVEARAIAQLLADAAAITTPAFAPDIDALDQQLTAARAAQVRAAQLAEQVRHLAELAARHDDLAVALADADHEYRQAADQHEAVAAKVADEDALQRALTAARRISALAADRVDEARDTVTRLETTADRLAVARKEHDTLTADLQEQLGEIDLLKLAERAYGRDGIPALIVENAAIPQLEVEANRILGELGGATGDCRIELRTQRALKTTEALRETLDIIIVTPAGERAYETFSGGERTRLNLALRIALARLLAHRRGADSRLLAIDEPEFLDEHGVGRLADVLRGLSGDFDRVLLVSHHPVLATSFDRVLFVARRDGISRVDVDAREAVLA